MEKEQNLSLQLIPRTAKGIRTNPPTYFQAMTYASNLFSVDFKDTICHQYSIQIEPNLPKDSFKLMDLMMRSIRKELNKSIQFKDYKGEMIWGLKKQVKPLTLISQFSIQGENHKYEVLIRYVKSIELSNYLAEQPEKRDSIHQILNIDIKNKLKKQKMIELSPGVFFNPNEIDCNQVEQSGLKIWRGFKINIAVYNCKQLLQVDVCSRVIRIQNFLQTLDKDIKNLNLSKQLINNKYNHSSILTKYGASFKSYKIEQIDFNKSPNSKFSSKEGKQLSYIQYFKIKYGYTIKNQKQPLIKVKGVKNKHKQNQNIQQYIYLVPQMVNLTGLTDDQRNNFNVMRSIAQFTKLSPTVRMQQIKNVVENIKSSGDLMMNIKDNPQRLSGFLMEYPRIQIGNKNNPNIKNGSITIRDRILTPHTFKQYIFCYSRNNQNTKQAYQAFDTLKSAAKTFGIEMNEPFFAQMNGRNFADWEQDLYNIKSKKKDKKIQIIIFFIKPYQQKYYGDIKKFVTKTFDCPSQVIKVKTLTKNKNIVSCASKIILQMNAKTGSPLWRVPNEHQYWRTGGRKVAVAAISTSKGKKGSNIGFIGSITEDLTRSFSDCKKINSRENLSAQFFKRFFTQWLQNCFSKQDKFLPTDIIVYREGLNDVQAKNQLQFQIQGLNDTIEIVKKRANFPNYLPKISYLLVNRTPNSKFFQIDGKIKNSYYNPQSGSVIFEDLSKDGMKQFHLASAYVREGSCNPVQYKVGYENFNHSLDSLAELTFNQCFAYFNWTGAVKVPAALQCANKLSKLCSQIGDELSTTQKNSDLKTKPFYL